MKHLVFYDLAPGGLEKARALFPAHKVRLDEFHDRGVLIAAGPLMDEQGGALAIFTTREAAEEFVREDPFVLQGVVAAWKIRPWNAAFI
jgi:uncharacterized protein YciI